MSSRLVTALIVVQSLLIIGLGIGLWSALSIAKESTIPDELNETHIHADLRVVVNGSPIDFAQEKYRERSPDVHFHEGSEPVVHVEAGGVTWGTFFRVHGMELSKACFQDDGGGAFCTGEGAELRAYINGVRADDLAALTIADLARVLVFYGAPDEEAVQAELAKVTADACVQSGNCFGRDEEEAKAAELESGCTATEPCKVE